MSFLNEGEPLWTYLNEVLHERGFSLFDGRLRSASALDLTVLPATITPEHRSVSIDDCSKLCRELRTQLLVEGEKFGIKGEDIELDISSPGVNRTLRLKSHFSGAVGERVKLVVDTTQHDGAGEAQRVVIGMLKSSGDDFIELEEESAKAGSAKKKGNKKSAKEAVATSAPEVAAIEQKMALQRIPLERVRKANVEFDFSNI